MPSVTEILDIHMLCSVMSHVGSGRKIGRWFDDLNHSLLKRMFINVPVFTSSNYPAFGRSVMYTKYKSTRSNSTTTTYYLLTRVWNYVLYAFTCKLWLVGDWRLKLNLFGCGRSLTWFEDLLIESLGCVQHLIDISTTNRRMVKAKSLCVCYFYFLYCCVALKLLNT